MKVNNNTTKPLGLGQARAKELESGTKTQDLNKGQQGITDSMGSAKVAVSSEAQALQKAKAIASKDTVDEAKVARLQKLIDEGKYKVDAKAVSDRMVDEHLLIGE